MALDPRETEEFCFFDPVKLNDPSVDYAWLRENRPVLFHPTIGAWFVFRYDDVSRLFRDPRLSNRRTDGLVAMAPPEGRADMQAMRDIFDRWVLMLDGERHMRIRKLLQPRFTEHAVGEMAPRIQVVVDELLVSAAPGTRLDAAQDFAYQVPVRVIADILGVAADDREIFIRWSDNLSTYFNNLVHTVADCHEVRQTTEAMAEYIRARMASRRQHPESDLISDLLRSGDADASHSHALDDADIISNCIVLLLAGHHTTRNLVGNALWLLLQHPEQLAAVRADASLLRGLIEETLRFDPVHPIIPRVASEEVIVGDQRIAAGQVVFLVMASANRDPSRFPDGNRFDVRRTPGRHLAFGDGPHYCLGAILARKEAEIALGTLLRRFPALRLDGNAAPVWIHYPGIRGPSSLPVLL